MKHCYISYICWYDSVLGALCLSYMRRQSQNAGRAAAKTVKIENIVSISERIHITLVKSDTA